MNWYKIETPPDHDRAVAVWTSVGLIYPCAYIRGKWMHETKFVDDSYDPVWDWFREGWNPTHWMEIVSPEKYLGEIVKYRDVENILIDARDAVETLKLQLENTRARMFDLENWCILNSICLTCGGVVSCRHKCRDDGDGT